MVIKRTHVAIESNIYDAIAAYARACGYTPRKFLEAAAVYCMNNKLNSEWTELFATDSTERASCTQKPL